MVCVRACAVSCDTIESGVMWNSIQLYLPGIHVLKTLYERLG